MPKSSEHQYQQERIQRIAQRKGYIAEIEVPFICFSGYHSRVVCYHADIFIVSNRKATAIIVEVDGHKGHSSSYQSCRDERRTEDVKNLWGDHITVRRYTLWELEIATDQEIEEDLKL